MPARRGAAPPPQAARRNAGRRNVATPAREVALVVLRAVADRGAYANLLLPSLLAEHRLHGRDAALATELAYGTLRGRGTYDAVLGACSTRALADVDPSLLDVLRLGTHQLLATRIGPHAAVATSVALARAAAGAGATGFANAVLRRVATRDLDAWIGAVAPDRGANPVGYLAVKTSHPGWIVAAVSEALGEEPVTGLPRTEAALAANGTRPHVALCAVPGLATPADLIARGARAARWSPFGAYSGGGDPAGLPEVRQGRAAVQDEASQLAALALARADAGHLDGGAAGTGQRRWLDLCAGPGGKARLLAGLAAGRGARLVASDVREHRARLVRAALPAAGTAAIVADGTEPAWQPASFDRVIAYVPCSPHVTETRAVVGEVTAARDDVLLLDAPAVLSEVPDLACPGPGGRYAQFWPHLHGTDAIFLALLRRT